MRLIDADALLDEVCEDLEDGDVLDRIPPSYIDDAPTVDAVEVVRCRYCKHYHAAIGWCDKLSFFQTSDGEPCSPSESRDWKTFAENDFCSCGERRPE